MFGRVRTCSDVFGHVRRCPGRFRMFSGRFLRCSDDFSDMFFVLFCSFCFCFFCLTAYLKVFMSQHVLHCVHLVFYVTHQYFSEAQSAAKCVVTFVRGGREATISLFCMRSNTLIALCAGGERRWASIMNKSPS